MGIRSTVVVVVCVLLAAVAPARAEELSKSERQHVKALYTKALRAYNLAEYGEALTGFKEAYRIKPDPAFLFNIAQCYRQLGDFKNAAREYRAYLREAHGAKNRGEVQKLLEEMEHAIAEQRANQPPTAVVEPSDSTMPPPGGSETAPAPAPPPAPAPDTGRGHKAVGGALLGVGAALVVTGVALAVVGSIQDGQAHDPKAMLDLAAREDKLASAHTLGVTGYVALGVGAAVAVGGIVALVLPKRAPVQAAAFVAPGTAALAVGGAF